MIDEIVNTTEEAFSKVDLDLAKKVEPIEEVVDDMVNVVRDNHIARLRQGKCHVVMDKNFLNLLTDIERISDICSNIGIAVVTRSIPEIGSQSHEYISSLHKGNDEQFNISYKETHDKYFNKLKR